MPEQAQPSPVEQGGGGGTTLYGQSIGVQGTGSGTCLRPDLTDRSEGEQIMQTGPYVAVAVRILEEHDWALHHPNCQGIVAEIGGATSHAAVVAREENIPCSLNAKGATRIQNGDQVEVDGSDGTVHVNGGGEGLEPTGHGDATDMFVWCNQSWEISKTKQIPDMIEYFNSFGLWTPQGITGTVYNNGYAQIDKYPQAQESEAFEKWLKSREPTLQHIGTEPPQRGRGVYSPRNRAVQQPLKTDLYRFVWFKGHDQVAAVDPQDPNKADTTHNYLLQQLMGSGVIDMSDPNAWNEMMSAAAGIVYDNGEAEIFREKMPGDEALEQWIHAQFPEVTHIQYVEGANPFGATASISAMEDKIIQKIAAEEPWKGLTAYLGGRPMLVIDKVYNVRTNSEAFFLEDEKGNVHRADFAFTWEEPRVETNRLVAASRSIHEAQNPTLLSYDPDDGSWLVVADGGDSTGLDLGGMGAPGPATHEHPGAGHNEPTIEVRAACPHCHSDQHLELASDERHPHSDEKKYVCHNCGKWSHEHELEVSKHDQNGQDQNPEDVNYEEHDDDAERHQDPLEEKEVHDESNKFDVDDESESSRPKKKVGAALQMPYPGGQGIHNGTSAAFTQAGIHATVTAPGLPQPINLPFSAGNMFIMIKMFQAQGLLAPGQPITVESDNPQLAQQIIEQQAGAQAKTAYSTGEELPSGGRKPDEAITCPHCGSHTVETLSRDEETGKADWLCLTCDNTFKKDYRKKAAHKHPKGTRVEVTHPSKKGQKGSVVDHAGTDDGFGDDLYNLLLDNGDELPKCSEVHFKVIKSASIKEGHEIIHGYLPSNGWHNAVSSTAAQQGLEGTIHYPLAGMTHPIGASMPNFMMMMHPAHQPLQQEAGHFNTIPADFEVNDPEKFWSIWHSPSAGGGENTHRHESKVGGILVISALHDEVAEYASMMAHATDQDPDEIAADLADKGMIHSDEEWTEVLQVVNHTRGKNPNALASLQKGAPYPERSYHNAPDHSPHGQDWPAEVNAVYNACMREGGKEKSSCAAIAWSQYHKSEKAHGHGTSEEEGKKREGAGPADPSQLQQQGNTPPCPHCGNPTTGTPNYYWCPSCGWTSQSSETPGGAPGIPGAVPQTAPQAPPAQTFHSNVKESDIYPGFDPENNRDDYHPYPGGVSQDEHGLLHIGPPRESQMFQFLDHLRESGVTNMFGAAPYLEEAFGISRPEAQNVLGQWMRSFGQRQQHVKSAALSVGEWYTMYSPDYKVPDVIQVVDVNDHGVTANIEGDDKGLFPITLPHDEIEHAGYRFEPYSNPAKVIEAKVARRQFSAQEQNDLVNENLDGLARNFHKLNLEGTHYPQDIEASVDPLNEEFWLW